MTSGVGGKGVGHDRGTDEESARTVKVRGPGNTAGKGCGPSEREFYGESKEGSTGECIVI